MRIAAELRLKLQEVLAKECLYFSLTTDTWTDRGQRSFMALTLHYLTESFDVRSWTLEVKHFPGKHTGDAIARAITKAMERWNLDKHRCTILLRDGAQTFHPLVKFWT
ncbi:Zinc finger BED domain-containing hypothetical protein [Phytophthora megakarya]|uniref:Transposase n=1 Tax=Phytophthora megakarya TaxID=4795 RepID=A0A225UWR5_9STRA|nr:Zinc finger BED domain-containing hypothetical protein [Phytophthora megakarya]